MKCKLKPYPFCGKSDEVFFEPPESQGMLFQIPSVIGCNYYGFRRTMYTTVFKNGKFDNEAGAKLAID